MNKEELKKQIELLVKDDEKSQETIIKQSQEIERLNNIINELEKFINSEVDYIEYVVDPILDKLQQLKGVDKE